MDLSTLLGDLREATIRTGFVELAATSYFSFLAGASSPEALVRRARELGQDTIAIADWHGLYGVVRAHEEARRAGIRLIVAARLRVFMDDAQMYTVVLHVEDKEGYTNLCTILTRAHRDRPRDDRALARVAWSFVCAHARGLWALVFPGIPSAAEKESSLAPLVTAGRAAFGARLSLGVALRKDGLDRARLVQVRDAERTFAVPVCATNDVRYARPEDKPVLDVLSCIREGMTLDVAGRRLEPNAEACLRSEGEMAKIFSPHPAWIRRTRTIADACRFAITELSYRFPHELSDLVEEEEQGARSADAVLRKLTWEGARQRYRGKVPDAVSAQIERELELIAKLEVAAYFLSVRAIVEIARARDILCQGRGSAANSAVCYCLGITAVDPARSNLLFERFLSLERREPPDIDVDFEHERREEVIQEIYARYGRDRAAMVCEVVSYRGKSALREVGKVFGLSLDQIDRLSDLVSWWDGPSDVAGQRLRDAGFDPGDARVRRVLEMASRIQGFPRHLSVHVGGFVLSAEPLAHVAPVEPATMPDRTIIPWDKDDLDTLGFFKVDVLGLGMLTAIRKTLALVQHDPRVRAPTAIEQLARLPPEDPVVYDALCQADTVGVFQIESRAQMAMLPRLLPRRFYDLVIEVAIVRPGPIQGGMVHPYLRRRNGEEAPDPPHPLLAPIVARTLGVPLFQEQVMQIAIVGAGYSGGEADQLRRDMAAWRKTGNLARHEARLLSGFAERGISRAFGEQLYKQIHGFGEYGFPESHAASFALLVYASAWLKVHHPAAFATGLLNSQPMGFYSPATILEDARRHGVTASPPSVIASAWDTTCLEAKVRVGLRQVKGLPEATGRRIEDARRSAPFASTDDLAARARIPRDEMILLAEAGALDGLADSRREALWKVVVPRADPGLLDGAEIDPAPALFAPLTRTEQLVLDYERTGLSVADHPMALVRSRLPRRVLSSQGLADQPHGSRVEVAGMVICRQRPGTASGVVFATLEDEHGFTNLVFWARVFETHRHVATTSGLLHVTGKVERQGRVVHVVVERARRLTFSDGGEALPHMSRDFH